SVAELAVSQSSTAPSRLADIRRAPSDDHTALTTSCVCAVSACSGNRVIASQMTIVLSRLAVNKTVPSGDHLVSTTAALWPSSSYSRLLLEAFQSVTVPFRSPAAIRSPSGIQSILVIAALSRLLSITRSDRPVAASHNRILPSLPPEAITVPKGDHERLSASWYSSIVNNICCAATSRTCIEPSLSIVASIEPCGDHATA